MALKLLFLYGLAIIAGALIPVQAATNAMLSKVTGHVLYSSLILFGVGMALVLVFILLFRPTPPSLEELMAAPLHSYAGGLIVATYVLSITFLAPRIGVGNAVLFIVTGQILSAALIDHYGLFGASIFTLNAGKIMGLSCMIVGLVIVNYSQKTVYSQ